MTDSYGRSSKRRGCRCLFRRRGPGGHQDVLVASIHRKRLSHSDFGVEIRCRIRQRRMHAHLDVLLSAEQTQ